MTAGAIEVTIEGMADRHTGTVAAIHCRSFPGHSLSALGPRFLRLYYRHVASDPQGICLVAKQAGEVCGFVAGMVAPQGFYRRLLQRHGLLFLLAGVPGVLRHPALIRKIAAAPRFAGLHPAGDREVTLASIAVVPEAGRAGVGRQLFAAFRQEAARRGGRSLHWGAKCSEHAAVAFYARIPGVERSCASGIGGEDTFEYRLRLWPVQEEPC